MKIKVTYFLTVILLAVIWSKLFSVFDILWCFSKFYQRFSTPLVSFCRDYALRKIKGPSKILFIMDALWMLLDFPPIYSALCSRIYLVIISPWIHANRDIFL